MEAYWADRLQYDKGTVTNVEYWNDIAQKCGVTFSARQIDNLSELDTESWMRFDQPMWDWIDELRHVGVTPGLAPVAHQVPVSGPTNLETPSAAPPVIAVIP